MATSGSGASTESETTPEPGSAVRLENVRKTYQLGEPVHALDGVSLEVPRGSYTAIMGPSGSGKSTLMNLVGCLDTPTEGTVVVDGEDVAQLGDRERTRLRGNTVGFVFQTFNLMPRLNALENVALPQLFRGVDRETRRERARDLLERVGLGDRADHLPNELSGGQRQRVALARALVNDPAIVLADEPSGNLDTETEADVLDLFAEFHDAGTTMIVVTHERHVAERAERIVHLLDGTIERIEPLEGSGTVDDARSASGSDASASADANAERPADGTETDDSPETERR
ncbi:ABC transporter ATP-binding protein [Halopiger aswanensis]|uniref:Putative ABC transport system ATP-binding protein n=1 Tax=Halopiger aswanensis TaxID=148449 RepID=A0A419WE20_9EURY|nr:ABC transporter ATP-binding protein [Halopiger aswanensis]RKD93715.1 putative ABC transport system ATP-binding protein [Halopiger aswanensis]